MAITIKVEPQEYQSAYNEVILVLDSDKKAESKFQYILDIDVDGVYSSRIKVQSNPQGFGVINLSKHLESYVSHSLDIADKEAFKKVLNSWATYDVAFSEEYVLETSFTSVTDNGGFAQYNYAAAHNFTDSDFVSVTASTEANYLGVQEITSVPSTTAIVTTTPYVATATGDTKLSNNTPTVIPDAVTMTGSKFIFNGVLKWIDVPNWDYSDYVADSTGEGKLLTNLPSTSTTDLQDRQTVNFYQNLDNEAKYLQVQNDGGSTFFFDNLNPIIGAETSFLSIGVGGFDINNAPLSGTVASSTPPIIDGNTKSYTVKLVDSAFNPSSEVLTFNVEDINCKFEGYRLLYLNRWGSYSSFNFALADSKSVSVNRKTFKQNYGSYDSATVTYGYESSARGKTVLDTDIREVYKITSDYITEAEGNLIEDLISSPDVYHLADNEFTFDTPQTIFTTAINNGFFQIRTGTAHGLNVGDTVKLAGFSDAAFNQEFEVLSITGTTFATLNKPLTVSPFTGGTETVAKQIFLSDGVLRAVNIKTSSVKVKQRKTDGLINYSLSFEYSNNNTVQR